MGDRKRGKQIDFIVSTGNPNDASSAANKKRVRSVAALKSWPERRKRIFEQLEHSSNGQGAFLVTEPELKPPALSLTTADGSKDLFKFSGPIRPPSHELDPLLTPQSVSTTYLAPQEPWTIDDSTREFAISLYHELLARVPATAQAVALVNAAHLEVCHCLQCLRKRRLAASAVPQSQPQPQSEGSARKKRSADGTEIPVNGVLAMITPPLSPSPIISSGKVDPFNCYPVPYKSWYDQVLRHMMTIYGPRGWGALKITDQEGATWEWYMTQLSLAEPALFYVRLLFGSGDMIRLGALRPGHKFWLRAQAIRCINEALTQPDRCCSDALILAIGRIALHEHMYGDKYASAHVHRPAQKRMIDMRGGMKQIEIPVLVKRLMRWSDRIMSVGSGTVRFLDDDYEKKTSTFTLRESVTAIQKWVPNEVPGVRSKIKISDLINDEDQEEEEAAVDEKLRKLVGGPLPGQTASPPASPLDRPCPYQVVSL